MASLIRPPKQKHHQQIPHIKIETLHCDAVLPQKDTGDSTGYDISCCNEFTVPPHM